MASDQRSEELQARRLGSFLREHRARILADWETRLRAFPSAHALPRPALIDHIPELLESIATVADELEDGHGATISRAAAASHAIFRLEVGFELGTVVAELAELRRAAIGVWMRNARSLDETALDILNASIDRAVAASVELYTRARNGTIDALNRISSAALESTSLGEFLDRLLRVLVETTASIDVGLILLRHGQQLITSAAIGLEGLEERYAVALKEGLAERVVRDRRAIELRSDETALERNSRDLRGMAAYGVPILQNGSVAGVAVIASRRAAAFTEDDKLILSMTGHRAASAIAQQITHAKLEALIEAAPVGVGFIDRDLRYERVNKALAEMNGRPVEEHIGRAVKDVLPDPPASELVERIERIFETGEPLRGLEIELDLAMPGRAEPQRRCMLMNYFPVRANGGHVFGVGVAISDITPQKVAREEAERRALELDAVIEAIPDAIYIGNQQGLTRVNRAGLEQLGYAPDSDVLGDVDRVIRNVVLYDVNTHAVVPREERPFKKALQGQGWRGEYLLRRGGAGEDRYVRSVAAPVLSGGSVMSAVVVNTDITQTKRDEVALREREASFRLFFDLAAVGLAQADPKTGRLTRVNARLAEITGYSAEELLEMTLADLIQANGSGRPTSRDIVVGMLPAQVIEKRMRRKDASVIFVELRTTMLVDPRGDPALTAAVLLDMTERKRAEEERTRLLESESSARRAAEDAVRFRDNVLSVVSHDLRNPLQTILTGASIMMRHTFSEHSLERVHKHAEAIFRASERMDRLIRDLADVAAIQEGRLTIELKPVDVSRIVDETLLAFQQPAAERRIELVVEVEPGLPQVSCDLDRIIQALSNEIQNAIKVTPLGGRITVRIRRDGREILFSVEDTGPGIPSALLERVFDRTWRDPGASYKGTGLGLTIAKGIIDAHGGRIWAESKQGAGATFCFTLPILEPAGA